MLPTPPKPATSPSSGGWRSSPPSPSLPEVHGSVAIPEVLHPYTRGATTITAG